MLFYKNNQWNMCGKKIKYIQNGMELESYIGVEGEQWWLDYVAIHIDTSIVDFIDLEFTEMQLVRLEMVNKLNVSDGHSEVLSNFVIRDTFPNEVNHILKDLQNKIEREAQEPYVMELDFRISMMELGF